MTKWHMVAHMDSDGKVFIKRPNLTDERIYSKIEYPDLHKKMPLGGKFCVYGDGLGDFRIERDSNSITTSRYPVFPDFIWDTAKFGLSCACGEFFIAGVEEIPDPSASFKPHRLILQCVNRRCPTIVAGETFERRDFIGFNKLNVDKLNVYVGLNDEFATYWRNILRNRGRY